MIVPPYNDEQIIAGQGTIGLEILEDLPEVETVFAPVGGGGMISGVATAIKLSKPSVKVIGVEPELAGDAQASLRAGKIVQFPADEVVTGLSIVSKSVTIATGTTPASPVQATAGSGRIQSQIQVTAASLAGLLANPGQYAVILSTADSPAGAMSGALSRSRRVYGWRGSW